MQFGEGAQFREGDLLRLTKEVTGRAQTQNPLDHSLPLTSANVSSKSQQSLTCPDNWCPATPRCSLSLNTLHFLATRPSLKLFLPCWGHCRFQRIEASRDSWEMRSRRPWAREWTVAGNSSQGLCGESLSEPSLPASGLGIVNNKLR